MAKKSSTHWNVDMLTAKGFIKQPDGSYSPPPMKSKFIKTLKIKESLSEIGLGLIEENEITIAKIPTKNHDFIVTKPIESFLEIHGVVAGLNGSDGLMRAHWSKISKIKELYRTIIRQHFAEGKVRIHHGEVRIKYIGYKVSFMDWDNFCASFKHIGDSLVKEGIIKDDNPKIVVEFIPQQLKCRNNTFQKSIVIIEDIIQ